MTPYGQMPRRAVRSLRDAEILVAVEDDSVVRKLGHPRVYRRQYLRVLMRWVAAQASIA